MSLRDKQSIKTALFVKIDVTKYFTVGSGIAPQTLAFSDWTTDYVIDGTTYTALGNLVEVTETSKVLRPNSQTVSITVSGIPDKSIEEIVKSELKGTSVDIKRVWFNNDFTPVDDVSITNPVGRFSGFVNNYSLVENWDIENKVSSNTIVFDCASFLNVLEKKKAGRTTSPQSMKKFYPNDVSFDRVPSLAGARINFGD
jgi:hypothetical protein